VTIQNNIVYGSGPGGDYTNSGSVTQDHNLFGVDPIFVNAAARDLHIQSSSPAKNAGTTIAAVPTDKDGKSRPQSTAYCIGAYEDAA